jgi:hypothetical protein
MKRFIFSTILCSFIVYGSLALPSYAQTPEANASSSATSGLPTAQPENTNIPVVGPDGAVVTSPVPQTPVAGQVPVLRADGEVDPTTIPSLLFTYWEHTSIVDAKNDAARNIGVRRSVTQEELDRAQRESMNEQEKPKPPPEARELRMGGILYTAKNDWTIWLNEQRITPNALPPEIVELRVYRHYVDMKWYDDYTSRIFPIRLRAHQRFNLDSRIFLPG